MAEVELQPGEWMGRAEELKKEGWQLASLCGLDRLHLGHDERFGIVVHLVHHERKERMRVHVAASGEPPALPSVTPLWAGANFMEREAFDLFGIHFDGHPNLTRILLPDEWEGHPLRKDYGVGKVAVDFIEQPFLQIQSPGQSSKGREALQELDELGQTTPEGAER
jgi:NADH:ubiquinone oxidoreductase subunit C